MEKKKLQIIITVIILTMFTVMFASETELIEQRDFFRKVYTGCNLFPAGATIPVEEPQYGAEKSRKT